MKNTHTPRVNARYWAAITLASVFGTNLGDLYAHTARLGIVKGLAVLAFFAALVFLAEPFVAAGGEIFYWLVIILIRTGATNIADFLMYRLRLPGLALALGSAALIALFSWGTHRLPANGPDPSRALPGTNAAYWLAMLSAGVFGTIAGDLSEHSLGEGLAAILLTALLFAALFTAGRRAAQVLALYWLTVAVARTTGTAVGDWFAENRFLHIGLPLSTLLSGLTFLAILLFWPGRSRTSPQARA